MKVTEHLINIVASQIDDNMKSRQAFMLILAQMVLLSSMSIINNTYQYILNNLNIRISNMGSRNIILQSSEIKLDLLENSDAYDLMYQMRMILEDKWPSMLSNVLGFIRSLASISIIFSLSNILSFDIFLIIILSVIPEIISRLFNSKDIYKNYLNTIKSSRIIASVMNLHQKSQVLRDYITFKPFKILLNIWQKNTDYVFESTRALGRRSMVRSISASAVATIFLGIASTLIIKRAIYHSVSIGEFSLLLGAIQQFQTQISSLINYILSAADTVPYLLRQKEIENTIYKLNTELDSISHKTNSIAVANVSFSYGESLNPILYNIDARIEEGEITYLIGKNGSGKTTLLKIISQHLTPTTGGIFFKRKDGTNSTIPPISVVYQDSIMYPLKIQENITLGALPINHSRLENIIETLNIPTNILDKMYGRELGECDLSSGQIQKILIARALYSESKILILDEPTNHLDKLTKLNLLNYLKELRDQKIIVIATHDSEFIQSDSRRNIINL
ncbi:ATP-binding cassette domain-containing protein [Deinococcus arboris]|uniref:ATP-binding cassette domain-containing protein n=1 Tax=Deinococcus arboris TaxID=2682977 RepID=UPI0018DE9257|nr:ATP-binding cassette domain-containing protein [Deinococcus arboris]